MPEFDPAYKKRTIKPGDRVFRIPRVTSWHILPTVSRKHRIGGVSTTLIIYGMAFIVFIGALLLSLPIATQTGESAPLIDVLFTATSATCVTGLVVVDTADYWSGFGQAVIAILMHAGGFGFMVIATMFLLALGRRIGLKERILIRQSMGITRLGGVVRIVQRMALLTFVIELLGTGLIYLRLSTIYAPGVALWKSAFHSISSFNNAGFDLFGGFRSVSGFQDDPLFILTTTALVILGGLSYLVIADMARVRNFTRFSLDSKLVVTTTIGLLLVGTVVTMLTEMNNPATLGGLSWINKVLNSFFHSAAARTAGFSTLNVGGFAIYTLFFTMVLMFIGGATGSTAGGIKVNTFGMLIHTVISTLRGKDIAVAFGREFTVQQIYRALTLVLLSFGVISIFVFALTITDNFTFLQALFETVSAFGTVGLTTGLTPNLSVLGKLLIIMMMFIGRIGPLTLILSLAQRQHVSEYKYPRETIRIG